MDILLPFNPGLIRTTRPTKEKVGIKQKRSLKKKEHFQWRKYEDFDLTYRLQNSLFQWGTAD